MAISYKLHVVQVVLYLCLKLLQVPASSPPNEEEALLFEDTPFVQP